MKKFLCFCLALGFCLSITACSSSTTEHQGTGSATNSTQQANLGDCNVIIKSCRISADYEGNPVVIITYTFTNYSDEAASFWSSTMSTVFQDGIELEKCYLLSDNENFDSEMQDKKIKTGVTITVEEAFSLSNTTSDIEVEVEELFFLSDKKITKTFTLK